MAIAGDLEQEAKILQHRLTLAEQEAARAHEVVRRQAAAIADVDAKTYYAMKQLLTANDVNRDQAMRVNILEIMNTLRRYASDRFKAAGIIVDASNVDSRPE